MPSAKRPSTVRSPALGLSSFHGRAAEREAIVAKLREGRRLLCVWGPFGAGKTRLVREIAASFGPGVAPHSPLALGARLVAEALPGPGGTTLLLVDGLDGLGALREALPETLRRHPQAAVLVTSRRRPVLDGMHEVRLGGLAIAAEAAAPAVALFLDRCADAGTKLDVAPSRIAALVECLDGLPLFIERAAMLVPALGLDGVERAARAPLQLLSMAASSPASAATAAKALVAARAEVRRLPSVLPRALAAVHAFEGAVSADDLAAVLDVAPAEGAALAAALHDAGVLAGHAAPDLEARLRPWAMFRAGQPAPSAALIAAVEARVLQRAGAAATAFAEAGDAGALDELRARRADLLALARRALGGGPRRAAVERAVAALIALDALVMTEGPAAIPLDLVDQAVQRAESTGLAPETVARLLALRARGQAVRPGSSAISDLGRALALLEASPAAAGALLAMLRVELGVAHHHRRELDAAAALYSSALAGAGGNARIEARAFGNLAAVDHDRGETALAAAGYERAVAIAAAVGDTRLEAIHSAHLALIEQENGAARSAQTRFERAVELLQRLGDRRLLAITLGNLGMLHCEEGRLTVAHACQERALRELALLDDPWSMALGQARLSSTLALMDEVDQARAWQERSGRTAHADARARQALSRLVDGFVALALARRAAIDARDEDLAPWLARAEGSAREVATMRGAGDSDLLGEWDDLRTLSRVLQRNLDATAAGGATSGEALLVTPESRWFRPPRGEWHDLRQRSAARRILERLCDRHLEQPGEGLRVDDLRDAGWPGERILPAAAKNRVYVVLNQLRGLGLRRWLRRSGEGWALDPRLAVHRVAQGPVPMTTRPYEGP